jgi:hypothetical protein
MTIASIHRPFNEDNVITAVRTGTRRIRTLPFQLRIVFPPVVASFTILRIVTKGVPDAAVTIW